MFQRRKGGSKHVTNRMEMLNQTKVPKEWVDGEKPFLACRCAAFLAANSRDKSFCLLLPL